MDKKRLLKEQLAAWRRETAAFVTTRSGRGRSWPVYAAAAGSALAMSTNASAGLITYSGLLDLTASVSGVGHHSSKNLSIAGDAFRLSASDTAVGFERAVALVFNNASTRHISFLGNDLTQHVLSFGATIGPAAGSFARANAGSNNFEKFANTAGMLNAPWPVGQSRFAGFSVHTGTSNSKGTITGYGWLRLKFFAQAGKPSGVELIDYAYTTDDTAITAGATAPEPGTAALGLLAAGAAAIEAWRRKRKSIPAA